MRNSSFPFVARFYPPCYAPPAMTDRRRPVMARPSGGSRLPVAGRRSQGPERRLGPIPITPTSVLLTIALVGSVAFLFYVLTVRAASQIPLLATGLAVLGAVFLAVAVTGLLATWRSSVSGRDGRALAHAVVGGLACLAAAGCFALAIILGMVSRN
jgi:hypothetical protein